MKTHSTINARGFSFRALKAITLAVVLTLSLLTGTAHAQKYAVIKSFGNLTNVTGIYPNAPLVEGPDGTLYGSALSSEGTVRGTIFKLNSDGTGFTVLKWFINAYEAGNPTGGLVLSGSTLYGTTSEGGGVGTVFRMNTDGTDYTVLKVFPLRPSGYAPDGAYPCGGLVLSGATLYGTTQRGGEGNAMGSVWGYGTVFKVNTNGTGFAVLKSFNNTDGKYPQSTLVLSGSTLYGTACQGGTSDSGTIFRVNTDGSGFAVLKNYTNSLDGALPLAGLLSSGGKLYGTTLEGGSQNNGTVFKMDTSGTSYEVLKHFSAVDPTYRTNSDGAFPWGSVIISGDTLYGTTGGGGAAGSGTVFKINSNGTAFTVTKAFAGSPADGAVPSARLLLSGSNLLYGTTCYGGSLGSGTVFRVGTNGSDYAVLKHFGRSDPTHPWAGLILSGNTFYGTTERGGSWNNGTVFKMSMDGTGCTVLKSFAYGDGAYPQAGVTLSGSTLYGTTWGGGSLGVGTIFRVNTDGTDFAVLKELTGDPDDGSTPAGLVVSGSTLYGTSGGGSNGLGTVFKVNTNGMDYTVLKHFTWSDGSPSQAGLTLSGSTLYGTGYGGGSNNLGTVFKVNTDGTDFTVLKHFDGSDGAWPYAGLVLSGSTLYGTTKRGGSSDNGTLFKLNTDGTGFTVLKEFSDYGTDPSALLLSGSMLYGTTAAGGNLGCGTVFKVNTDGSGYTVLKHFTYADGLNHSAPLVLSGSDLYGTTYDGGELGEGTVFKIDLATPVTVSLGPVSVSNGVPHVGVMGAGGLLLQIQVSTNLLGPWEVLTDLLVENDTGQFSDPAATNSPMRFYRALAQ